jgi:Leu/Phe-tRNA-protein transferase
MAPIVSRRPQNDTRNSGSAVKRSRDNLSPYIPPHLRQFVAPYHGDFCYSPIFDAGLISALMAEGFLPIATEGFLLPKLHERRCVIRLDQGALHVSKSVRKKASKFRLTVNQAFDDVVRGCRNQHGSSCWLYDPLVSAFKTIHSKVNHNVTVFNTNNLQLGPCPVRLYSVEIWNEHDQLVGGELAYNVGSILTSLTGFCAEASAGSVQLGALGRLLVASNFTMWDLGMEMTYKKNLGATLMKRADYVQYVHSVRLSSAHVTLPSTEEHYNCRMLIDQAQCLEWTEEEDTQNKQSKK